MVPSKGQPILHLELLRVTILASYVYCKTSLAKARLLRMQVGYVLLD